MIRSCIFDIETNGLDEKLTRVHCMVIHDIDTNNVSKYDPDDVPSGLAHLSQFDVLIGHNIISFDLPALKKIFNWEPKEGSAIRDTLCHV